MELRVLNYFLMVAREENITRASEQLHVTQPTLSRQMMQLEKELGVKLFDRNSHNIILTQEGNLLRQRAQELITLAEKTQKEVSGENTILTGEISIGSGEFKSVDFLAELVYEFNRKYPDIRYDLYSGNADNIKEQMDKGLIDIALLSGPVDIGKYEFLRIQHKESWGVLVREDFPLAKKETICPGDLPGLPLITTNRELGQKELANWFGEFTEQMEIKAAYNLLYNAAVMVKKGLGIALCLQLNVTYEGLKFIPFAPKLEQDSMLVWKKNQTMAPLQAAFVKFIKEYIREKQEP